MSKIIPAGRPWLALIQFFISLLITIVVGYGSVRFTEGQTQQRLNTVESQTKSNKDLLDKGSDRFVTREEFKQYIEATREDLKDIKTDVREIRSTLQRK